MSHLHPSIFGNSHAQHPRHSRHGRTRRSYCKYHSPDTNYRAGSDCWGGYIRAVKGADKDINSLRNELGALANVLGKLRQQAIGTNPHGTSINPHPASLAELETSLRTCAAEMKALEVKLEPKKGLRKAFRRLKWPLKEKETLQAIAQIERYKSLFNLALTTDQL